MDRGAALTIPDGFVPLRAGNPFGELFGPVYLNAPAQVLALRVGEHLANPVGTVHGGAIATFADMQLSALSIYAGTLEAHTPTISLSVDYLDVARVGDWLEQHVEIDRITRRLLFCRSMIRVGARNIARASAVYRNHDATGYFTG